MSLNQSRVNKNESHYRKTGRPANSTQQRGPSGRGGKGGGGGSTGLPPSPSSSNSPSSSFSTNRSFKKSNGQGAQSWVIAASVNSDSNATISRAPQNALPNGAPAQSPLLDAPVSEAPVSEAPVKKSSDLSSQRSNRAVPRAPSSQSTSGTSDSTAPTSSTPGDTSGAFSLQFGSFVNWMQVPARTSSAPPNLDEQKHNQAQHGSFRSGTMLPISSIPREQQPRKDLQQSNSAESHPPPQAKRDLHIQVQAAPAVTNTQSSSAIHLSGVPMAIPLQKQQLPMQPSVPNPPIQAQGVTSLQMPMSLPVGSSTQVQQQMFVPGLQSHPLQHQGMVHQGHGLNFPPHMGHQLSSRFSNLGIGINPQFVQQQPPRRAVKITHPETHEELRLDKRNDVNLDGGPRSHPKSLQSQSIAYAPTHQINNYYRVPPNPMFFQSPTSLPLTSTEMASQASMNNYPVGQGSQAVSFMNPSTLNSLPVSKTGPAMHWIADSSNFDHAPSSQAVVSAASSTSRPVTVKPATGSIEGKVGSSLVSASSPVDEKGEMPKLLRPHVEDNSIRSQGDPKICSESSFQLQKSIPEPTGYIPSTKPFAVPSAVVPVERLPTSTSNCPPLGLTGETASNTNNTEGRREPVRRSNSIKDRLKKPSKKDLRHSQPQLQAEASASLDSSRDVTICPDNMQASPSKQVGPSASSLTGPSLGLEYSRPLEGGVSETVECITTPPSETFEEVHEGIGDTPVEGSGSTRVGEDSTCGLSNKSIGEAVSDNLGDIHNEQDDYTLHDIQPKGGFLESAEQQNAELLEQLQSDSKNIDGNKIKIPGDYFFSESSKVSNYSEQESNSIGTTVSSENVTIEMEQNETKNEARVCSVGVDRTGCNVERFNDLSSDSNDSEINPHLSVSSTDCCEVKSLTLEASKSGSVCLDGQEIPVLESGNSCQEAPHLPTPVISTAVSKLGEKVAENANDGLVRIPPSGSKDMPTLEVNKVKSSTARGKKKIKEILQKADAAGTTSDLYLAYKGPNEKQEPAISSESVDSTSSIDAGQMPLDLKEEDVVASKEGRQSEAEPDDWEDAADIASPKLKISDNGEQVHGGLQSHAEDVNDVMGKKKYSRDFLLTFSGQYTDLPAGFEVKYDLMEALMGSKGSTSKHVDRNPHPSSGRVIDRPTGVSRPDQRGGGTVGVERWNKSPGPFASGLDPRVDISQGGTVAGFRPGQGGNYGVLRNLHGQAPGQYLGGILSGPLFPPGSQGVQRNGSDADRWQRAADSHRGLIPSPQSPLQVMHKATQKYELRKVTDEEEAKQRQLKAILNKLTPQNFERLFEKVKEVNIDNAVTLSGVISQIFDKALMEPTFCEMYAMFCYHLASELPDFTEDNEKITFKRLLLNKCQEEFEKGEREQAEANRVQEDGEVKQTKEEREQKKIQARRRMLGNIRLIGELYKKKMLTERIMHECIKKLLGQDQKDQNLDEEDIEALCKLMSTIGEIIDHPKAKEHMDAYFEIMMNLSNNAKLSSRLRFMLRDAIDLRKNKWQQRRKVEGPKKIEELHRDAAQERQAQAGRLARGPSNNLSARRPTLEFSPRGSTMFSSPNTQTGAFRGFPSPVRAFGTQDVRWEEKQTHENRTLSVPLLHRPTDDGSITLGPQGGLARGLSGRGQPMLSSTPLADKSTVAGDSGRMTAGANGFSSVSEWTLYNSREESISRYAQERFMGQPTFEQSKMQEHSMYGNRDSRTANQFFDRSLAGPPSTQVLATSAVTQNVSSIAVRPEECLRKMSMAAIQEFYSAKDENEVALCIKDLNYPSFHPVMISIWVTDSFERKDRDRDLLARLIVTLSKSGDGLLTQAQLIQGVELILASLEEAVTDAPKAAEFLGCILGKIITENVVSLREIGQLIHEGGEEPGSLLQIGLGYEVFRSTLEMIRSEKGVSFLTEICTSSNSRLEDFRRPDPT